MNYTILLSACNLLVFNKLIVSHTFNFSVVNETAGTQLHDVIN